MKFDVYEATSWFQSREHNKMLNPKKPLRNSVCKGDDEER